MKGLDFLRGIYAASGQGIKQKTKPSQVQILKEIVRALGLNPEEVLTREALARSHRTIVGNPEHNFDQQYVDVLLKALKMELKREITVGVSDTVPKTV